MIEELLQTFSTVNYLLVILIFIILGYRPVWWSKKASKCRRRVVQDIPGPLSLPILGTRWIFSYGGYSFSKIHEFYRDMHQKYGPVIKEEALFNIPVISVFEKRDIEKVMKSAGKYPIRPPTEAIAQYRRSRPDRYASTGLVNEQGKTWHHLRCTLTTDLTSPKTISNFLPQAQAIADDWCNLLKQFRDSDGLVNNLEDTVSRLGLETSCALVLGRRMGFLLPGGESATALELAQMIHQNFIAIRDTYFGLPLWRFVETDAYRRLAESEERIYQLAMDLMATADEATNDSVLFQSVLKADIDEREKTAALVDFLAAGIHTLKNSMIFLLYLVAKHPQYQQKILEEPCYLKACITETFRLLPTANCLARITEENLELSGYHVNAGSVLLCHTGIACQDNANFKDAKLFKPERWLGEEKHQTISNSAYLVTPFGSGRRICPGKRFIEQVLPIFLENVVRNFKVSVSAPLELQFEFLLAAKAPIAMTFKDRC